MFEYFTDKAIAVIMAAQEEARRLGHNFVGTEQLLVGLLKQGTSIAATVLFELGMTLEATQDEVEKIIGRGSGFVPVDIPFTPKTKRVLEQAFQEARQFDHRFIAPEHLLLSLLREQESVAFRVLQTTGIDPEVVRTKLVQAMGEAAVPAGSPRQSASNFANRSSNRALEEFGTDLTRLAAEGKLDPVIGRHAEIERVVQILGRRTKNNPVLIGEPGVGKTAIAEGLAQRIVDQDVPDLLLDKQVISLSMGTLIAGTRFRGDFEERIKQVMEEVRQSKNIILVIDELHTLVGAGSLEGGMDAANLLKPALARGEFQCLGATTLDEYRQYIERDAALERRFQPVTVGEPNVADTIEILRGLRQRYEQHHRLTIADEALTAAATLSDQYIPDRFLPDKAIDLVDEAGSRVRFRYAQKSPTKELKQQLRQITQEKDTAVRVQDFDQAGVLRDRELELEAQIKQMQSGIATGSQFPTPVVTAEDIAQVVAAWTGVPVNKLTESESVLLMHLEDQLHQRVIGQEEAVTAVARAIRRSRVGLRNLDRPIASLFFSGPTGVGKTELAKALAAAVFGSEEAMIRLDMSEYMESHTVSKLIGSPPGYVGFDEGGQLTEAVRRKPYSVLLLDEIEKAHPDVFNLLLQILEDGRLTDARGRTVSFKNTVIITTSNIGSRVIEKGGNRLGFEAAMDDAATSQYNQIKSLVNEELKQYFRPELLNRLDEIIVFRQLNREEVRQIADLLIQQVNDRLQEQGISLEVTAAVKEQLIAEGYNPSYGARPLRRTITRLIEDHLAEAMLSGTVRSGDTAILAIDDDGQVQVRRATTSVLQPIG
ncbi:MAG: ATP-dependent Clp protease ATP-binding subunit [Leptolyngbyaceae cyanobacterium SL_7_1]|nr:ATP-dependent Clp protease ATP-binding subunit [Leptolyngbyaceae cyanobacterium SL_7_1]